MAFAPSLSPWGLLQISKQGRTVLALFDFRNDEMDPTRQSVQIALCFDRMAFSPLIVDGELRG